MINETQIREHMTVVGSDNQRVGMVDRCDGGRIKLAKNDPAAQGEHHYLPLDWVERVDGDQVCLNRSSKEAMQAWQSA